MGSHLELWLGILFMKKHSSGAFSGLFLPHSQRQINLSEWKCKRNPEFNSHPDKQYYQFNGNYYRIPGIKVIVMKINEN